MDRFSQSTFDGPAVCPYAFPESVRRDAAFFGPFHKKFRLSSERQVSVAATVATLFRSCGPAAIVRFVIAIVVDAVKLMLWGRPIPHVLVESQERRTPAVADSNASSAVTGICWVSGVAAPTNQALPYLVFWRVRLSVSCGRIAGLLAMKTPAALRLTIAETASQNSLLCSALTAAHPVCFAIVAEIRAKDSPATEDVPAQIFYTDRTGDRMVRSHDRSPETGLARMAGRFAPSGRSHFTPIV